MDLSNRWRPATLIVYLLASSSHSLFIFSLLICRPGHFDSVLSLALMNYLPPLGAPPRGIDFWLKSDHSCGCSPCCGVQMYHLTDRCVYTSENDPYQPSPGTIWRHDGVLLDGALHNPKCRLGLEQRGSSVRAARSSYSLVWPLIFVK